jgi:hypothetical protein
MKCLLQQVSSRRYSKLQTTHTHTHTHKRVQHNPYTHTHTHTHTHTLSLSLSGTPNSHPPHNACFTQQSQEEHDLRVCMNLLRRRNMLVPLKALREGTDVQLEHPIVSQLYCHIVEEGDMLAAEQLLVEFTSRTYGDLDDHLFDEHLCSLPYTPHWKAVTR